MKNPLILYLFFFFSCWHLALAQPPCYEPLRSEGLRLLGKAKYDQAINSFIAARSCHDYKGQEELDQLIKRAQNTWVKALENAIEEAQQKTDALEKTQGQLVNTINSLRSARQEAENYARKAERQARLTEANRLTLLSRQALRENEATEALYLAFCAWRLMEPLEVSPQVEQTFGEALLKGKTRAVYESGATIQSIALHPAGNRVLIAFSPQRHSAGDLSNFNENASYVKTTAKPYAPRLVLADLERDAVIPLSGQEGTILDMAFSPKGEWIITCADDFKARIWDLSGAFKGALASHTGEVVAVAISPQGDKILTCSRDNTACLWNADGQLLYTFSGHHGNVYQGQFDPSGEKVLTRSSDGTIRIWDLKGNSLGLIGGRSLYLYAAAFSPDGQRVWTGSAEGTVRIWNERGQVLTKLAGHSGAVKEIAFGPKGKTLLSRSLGKKVGVWGIDGKHLAWLSGHTADINTAVFHPSGDMILTASSDSTARLWDRNGELLHVFLDHRGKVTDARFSPDGNFILTTCRDGFSRLWDLDGRLLLTIPLAEDFPLSSVFSPDGKDILFCQNGNKLSRCPLPEVFFKELVDHPGFPEELILRLDQTYRIQYFEDIRDGDDR